MLMRWVHVQPVIAKSVRCSQIGFVCLIVVCHILIVGQLHMLVAAIYSKLSLLIEMRCSIVFPDFTSLLREHSLQDWGYVIRPIMSTQRKCNRFSAAWWVFPITPLVRWGMPWLHSSTFLSPNIATVHWNACTYTSLQENVYPVFPQVFVNSGDK